MITINHIIDRGEIIEIDYNIDTCHVNQQTPKQAILDYIISGELNKCAYTDRTGDVFDYLLPAERFFNDNQHLTIQSYLEENLL